MRHDPHADGCAELHRGARIWHGAYCAWYDHDRAGNKIRAASWGWFADKIVRWA